MDTKHTPTPWHEGVRGPNNMPVIGAKGLMIAHVCTGIDFQEQADANAAFIVKAVNAHESLCDALREMLNQYDNSITGIHYSCANSARAALAAAEGR